MAAAAVTDSHWLKSYATDRHRWRKIPTQDGTVRVERPCGIVESAFDADGRYFGGRADIAISLALRVNTRISKADLRKKIALAWTCVRLHHCILLAKAVLKNEAGNVGTPYFAVDFPRSEADAIEEAGRTIVHLEDVHAGPTDGEAFYQDSMNVARVVDPARELIRLFVHPLDQIDGSFARLRLSFVEAHQIGDGMSNTNWLMQLIGLLNDKNADLHRQIQRSLEADDLLRRLPVAQEDHYPRVAGSRARQRWFWVLTIVLRHVKKPMPPAFANPLRRSTPLKQSRQYPARFPSTFDYTKPPPLNTASIGLDIGKAPTQRLHRLCREARASIGAGCFVLIAMSMMALYESRFPDVPLEQRRPFIGSFPLNPRAFFNHKTPPDSLMLAFSDGIVLPFLPAALDVEARFRILVRQAQRQLAVYQKRPAAGGPVSEMEFMGSRGAGRLLAMNHIVAAERMAAKLPAHLRGEHLLPQGKLPALPNGSMATCGVSSTGRSPLQAGMQDLNDIGEGEGAFAADFLHCKQAVRVRDGEFLVGVNGSETHIGVGVSADMNCIDEALIPVWKDIVLNMLEPSQSAKL